MRYRAGHASRWLAGLVALTFIAPVFGCSNGNDRTYAGGPPAQAPARSNNPLSNMSTGKKLALLGGAAALYYLYKKHQNAKGTGAQGQYYRSKNGRVYYRDSNGNPVWVSPPSQGIQVPADEVQVYERGARDEGFRWDEAAGTYGGSSGRYAPSGPRGRF
jgi:hypothetical protein